MQLAIRFREIKGRATESEKAREEASQMIERSGEVSILTYSKFRVGDRKSRLLMMLVTNLRSISSREYMMALVKECDIYMSFSFGSDLSERGYCFNVYSNCEGALVPGEWHSRGVTCQPPSDLTKWSVENRRYSVR
jgi:hypothetical protein